MSTLWLKREIDAKRDAANEIHLQWIAESNQNLWIKRQISKLPSFRALKLRNRCEFGHINSLISIKIHGASDAVKHKKSQRLKWLLS